MSDQPGTGGADADDDVRAELAELIRAGGPSPVDIDAADEVRKTGWARPS
jgi:hypothetical protein